MAIIDHWRVAALNDSQDTICSTMSHSSNDQVHNKLLTVTYCPSHEVVLKPFILMF